MADIGPPSQDPTKNSTQAVNTTTPTAITEPSGGSSSPNHLHGAARNDEGGNQQQQQAPGGGVSFFFSPSQRERDIERGDNDPGLGGLSMSKTFKRSNTEQSLADSPIALVWKDLTVSTRSGGKVLLNNIKGHITTGFYAIMGPSGSGKTTLLNTLACRLDRNTKVRGDVRMNGQEYGNTELKKLSGYVMQDDLLNGNLTVGETLRYTAELRLPPSVSPEERQERIDEVLAQMGLTHAKETIVGSPLIKGISGGERKRLCVAMELLTRPKLLFLDEPTSGLDSVTALSLCTKLKKLASQGLCTVVCTIHQPQAKIFRLFDKLLLLKAGEVIFAGETKDALPFFAAAGFPCPAYENPADHFLDVITPSLSDSVQDLKAKEEKLKAHFNQPEVDLNLWADKPVMLPREQTPWVRQFAVLFRRTLKEQWRKRAMLATQLLQSIVMAVLIGTVFLQIGEGQFSSTRRQPVLFFCVINQGVFGSLMVINSFPAERTLSLRERAAGTYYVSAYFLAKTTAETLFQLVTPVLFSCTVYWLVGLQPLAGKFFIFTAFMILCSLAATSLALAVSAICRTVDMSVTVLPLVLEICRLFGGFFLSPANLPNYFSWLDALSYVKYTYVGISQNELDGLTLTCTPQQQKPDGSCPVPSGQFTIDALGLDYITIGDCAGILISYIVICRIIAFLGVRFIKW